MNEELLDRLRSTTAVEPTGEAAWQVEAYYAGLDIEEFMPKRGLADSQLRNWGRGERRTPPTPEMVADLLAERDALQVQVAAVRALCKDAMKLPTLEDPRPADDRVSPRRVLQVMGLWP